MVAVYAEDGLSRRQRDILSYVKRYYRGHGVPPSIRNIMEGVGISSTSVVDYNLKALMRGGWLAYVSEVRGDSRSIVPVRLEGEPCPLCGCGGSHP